MRSRQSANGALHARMSHASVVSRQGAVPPGVRPVVAAAVVALAVVEAAGAEAVAAVVVVADDEALVLPAVAISQC